MQPVKKWNLGHLFLVLMIFLSGIYVLKNGQKHDTQEINTEPIGIVPTFVPGHLYGDTWDNSSYCPKSGTSEGNVTVEKADLPGLRYKVSGNGFEPFIVEFWLEYANQPDVDRISIEITDNEDTAIDEIKSWLYPEWENRYLFMKTQSGEAVYFHLPVGNAPIKYGVLPIGKECE